MFCSNCGKSIDDKAAVCIHCGAPTRNFSANGKAPVDPNEPADKLMIIVSVILPIVGIILGIMEKNNGKIRAGSAYLKTGIISAICITAFTLLVVFLTTILPLILVLFLGVGMSAAESASQAHSSHAVFVPAVLSFFSAV